MIRAVETEKQEFGIDVSFFAFVRGGSRRYDFVRSVSTKMRWMCSSLCSQCHVEIILDEPETNYNCGGQHRWINCIFSPPSLAVEVSQTTNLGTLRSLLWV